MRRLAAQAAEATGDGNGSAAVGLRVAKQSQGHRDHSYPNERRRKPDAEDGDRDYRPSPAGSSVRSGPIAVSGTVAPLDPASNPPLQSALARAADGQVGIDPPAPDRPTAPGRDDPMTRRYVNQLANGDTVDEVFLVADKQLRANRQGNLYLHLELRDKTGAVGARLWNASESLARRFEPGDYLQPRGRPRSSRARSRSSSSHIDVVDSTDVEPDDFLPQSVRDVGKLMARLRELCWPEQPAPPRPGRMLPDRRGVRPQVHLRPGRHQEPPRLSGGLLEHVVTMLNAADRIADLYPEVDRDLLLTGIFLHDIGKIDELSYDRTFAYTDEGQLVGHLVMGVEMLREKVAKVADLTGEPFPHELLLRLKHMIVSHHGTHEFGSPSCR